MSTKKTEIKQGDIFFVNFDALNQIENEQSKSRPAIVVSIDIANQNSKLVIVCPITSKKKKNLRTHYVLKKIKYDFLKYNENTILTENIIAISKRRLDRYIGCVDKDDLKDIILKLQNNF